MDDEKVTLIYESTFDRSMRRTMDRVEEKIQHGERQITLDIHEFLHILGTMVSLERDRLRIENVLFGSFQSLRQEFNRGSPVVIKDPKEEGF